MKTIGSPGGVGARRQRGISLFIVLIAIVLLMFAATTLIRSIDTSTLVTGNLAFKQTALASADAATQSAITWLNSQTGTALQTGNDAAGYSATSADNCDLAGTRTPTDLTDDVNWSGNASSTSPNCNMDAYVLATGTTGIATGYTAAYVINRMCNVEGDPNATFGSDGTTPMICAKYVSATGGIGSTQVGAQYGRTALSGAAQHYYRITVRVLGPRGTVRFTQAFVVL